MKNIKAPDSRAHALPSAPNLAPPEPFSPQPVGVAGAESTDRSGRRDAVRGTTQKLNLQLKGSSSREGSAADPHAIAEGGVSGGGEPLPHLDQIQGAFGQHDLSSVRAHTGPAASNASAALGAEGFARGEDVALKKADLFTAAHEAAHVVQQRQGLSLPGGVGQAGDRHERHADSVAQRVVAGQDASDLLPSSPLAPSSSRAIQRFESAEHKMMGDVGSANDKNEPAQVELAPGYSVTFGDLTAMSGDFFTNAQEIRTFAQVDGKGAGTREEVEFVRVVKVGGDDSRAGEFSEGAKAAVEARYLLLAGKNSSHFTSPEGEDTAGPQNNRGNYRDNHEEAILRAAALGKAGGAIDDALIQEGFASHFLTDGYAAGHVRTERLSIDAYWNPRVPLFWTNVKLYLAEVLAKYINNDDRTKAGLDSIGSLWTSVRNTIDGMTLPTLQFGDLVSGAVHDYDNQMGVDTGQGVLLGDGQVMDDQNEALPQGAKTAELAQAAVALSLGEVRQAYQLGGGAEPADVAAKLRKGGQYAAEQIWPEAKPDKEQTPERKTPPWKQASANALLAHPQMQQAIGIFAKEKADDLVAAVPAWEDVEEWGIVVPAQVQEDGFMTFINDLRSNPIAVLQRVVDYTPNVGGGRTGLAADDFAMEYFKIAKDKGALSRLTLTQREKLVTDLLAGSCGNEEEEAIIDMFRSIPVGSRVTLVKRLGGGEARQGIKRLDGGVDWSQWDTLKRLLSESGELAPLL